MREVRIIAKDPSIDITVPLGNMPPTITGGLGGWEVIERQDDVGMTDWSGQTPLMQDISLLLDGFAENRSVERELNTILKLGRDPNGDERVPPVFRVHGPIHFDGKAWVLPADGIDLSGGEIGTIRRRGDGELLRQEVTLHLLEFVQPDTIKLRRKRGQQRIGVGPARPVSYTTRKGDTLVSIASSVFDGDWKRWKEIGQKNGISDPHRKLPAGRELRL